MERQRNITQMKEQGKNPQDQINEEKTGKLPEKEFRVMIIKMTKILKIEWRKCKNHLKIFKKDLQEITNKQTMTNNTITEIENTLEGLNSQITEAEEQISELEDTMGEINAKQQNKEKRMKRIEDSLRDLWDNIKCTSI